MPTAEHFFRCHEPSKVAGFQLNSLATISMATLFESDIPGQEVLYRGKVRDIYKLDDQHMMIVTSDRLSAFDVILPTPIAGKGKVLVSISNFWFDRMAPLVPNHLTDIALDSVVPDAATRAPLEGRTVIVRKLNALPVEAIVRGYIIGSGWKDYQREGKVGGISLPEGLRMADKLPEPIFTPSTKAAVGDHDENVDFDHMANTIGMELANKIRDVSLSLYTQAADYARERGIIIADTKFEFGTDDNGELILIDEALTPDSSRFWPAETYQPGSSPASFDKQYVRDYLETLDWNKKAPGPELPDEIVANTASKYREALRRLTE